MNNSASGGGHKGDFPHYKMLKGKRFPVDKLGRCTVERHFVEDINLKEVAHRAILHLEDQDAYLVRKGRLINLSYSICSAKTGVAVVLFTCGVGHEMDDEKMSAMFRTKELYREASRARGVPESFDDCEIVFLEQPHRILAYLFSAPCAGKTFGEILQWADELVDDIFG